MPYIMKINEDITFINVDVIVNSLGIKGDVYGSLCEDIIRKILLFYDDLNSDWLIIGRGKMIKDGTISQNEAPDFVNAKLVQALADANKALSAANETILQQQEMIAKHTNTGIYTPPHLAESEAKHSLSPVNKE